MQWCRDLGIQDQPFSSSDLCNSSLPQWSWWTANNVSYKTQKCIDGVRTYKRESQEQKRSLSNVLNAASNGQPVQFATKKPKLDLVDTEKRGHAVDQPFQHSACKYTHCYCHCSQLQLYRLLFHHYQLCKLRNDLIIIIQVLSLLRYCTGHCISTRLLYSVIVVSYMIPYCSSISEY